jgi:hypothetical protein
VLCGESTGAPSFALFAKGGIVRSHPLTFHGKQTCSLGDLGFAARPEVERSAVQLASNPGRPQSCNPFIGTESFSHGPRVRIVRAAAQLER